MKRVLSLCLCLIVCFSLVAVPAHAEYATPINDYYYAEGDHAVAVVSYPSDDSSLGKHTVYYPEDIQTAEDKLPMVIFCNGTGLKSDYYLDFIYFLVSRGYIIAGNDAGSTGTGVTTHKTLDFMLALNEDSSSVFCNKIDIDRIALIGHSQGGSSTINSASEGKFENSGMIKTIVSINGPQPRIAAGIFQRTPYDATLVKVPAFFIGSDDFIDDNIIPGVGICPMDTALTANMNAVDNDIVVIGQIRGCDHDNALDHGRGYIAAWLDYILYGNSFAAGAFEGLDGELFHNYDWRNTMHKTSGAVGEDLQQMTLAEYLIALFKNMMDTFTQNLKNCMKIFFR